MIKVKIITSDRIIEVTNNVAFGLIDSGRAVLYSGKPVAKKAKSRMMVAEPTKRYKTRGTHA